MIGAKKQNKNIVVLETIRVKAKVIRLGFQLFQEILNYSVLNKYETFIVS